MLLFFTCTHIDPTKINFLSPLLFLFFMSPLTAGIALCLAIYRILLVKLPGEKRIQKPAAGCVVNDIYVWHADLLFALSDLPLPVFPKKCERD